MAPRYIDSRRTTRRPLCHSRGLSGRSAFSPRRATRSQMRARVSGTAKTPSASAGCGLLQTPPVTRLRRDGLAGVRAALSPAGYDEKAGRPYVLAPAPGLSIREARKVAPQESGIGATVLELCRCSRIPFRPRGVGQQTLVGNRHRDRMTAGLLVALTGTAEVRNLSLLRSQQHFVRQK